MRPARAVLAAEKSVNLRGIRKTIALLIASVALIARQHFASRVQGGDRPRRSDREQVTIGFLSAVRLRAAALPLDNHRSGDQQHKKERHQDRGYQPLTKIECGEFGI
jgi:hypothetical protein